MGQVAGAAAADDPPVVVSDVPRARVRQPGDLPRLLILLTIATMLVVGGVLTSGRSRLRSEISDFSTGLPHAYLQALFAAGVIGIVAAPLLVTGFAVLRAQLGRLAEALAAGAVAFAVMELVNLVVLADPTATALVRLARAIAPVGGDREQGLLDVFLAIVVAFVTVMKVSADGRLRGPVTTAIVLYAASTVLGHERSVFAVLLSVVVGALVGVLARLSWGQNDDRPDGLRIAGSLADQGLPLAELRRTDSLRSERSYAGVSRTGELLDVVVFDRVVPASALLTRVYRALRLRPDVVPSPLLAMERLAERRTVLALAAQQAEVPVPQLVSATPCGGDSLVVVYRSRPATTPQALDDAQLDQVWRELARLHGRRVTHMGLGPGQVRVEEDGAVSLPALHDGSLFASDRQLDVDRVRWLVTGALSTDVPRSVTVARRWLGDETLQRLQPLIQPLVLDSASRAALHDHPRLCEELRTEVGRRTGGGEPDPVKVERFRPRTVLSVAALTVAGYLLVAEFGSLDLRTTLVGLDYAWIPLAAAGSVLTYLGAALCLQGAVREQLSVLRTTTVQLATSFANLFTPPSLGGVAVNVQYLRRASIADVDAVTSVATVQILNFGWHVALLAGFAAVTGTRHPTSVSVPGWVYVLLVVLAGGVTIASASSRVRGWALEHLLRPLRHALPRIGDILTTPRLLLTSTLGNLLLNGGYVVALWASVRATGATPDFLLVTVVYLAGVAVGSAAPTPGGLGVIEVALSSGLVTVGVPAASAIAAVLVYRILTYWIPIPLGWLALNRLVGTRVL